MLKKDFIREVKNLDLTLPTAKRFFLTMKLDQLPQLFKLTPLSSTLT